MGSIIGGAIGAGGSISAADTQANADLQAANISAGATTQAANTAATASQAATAAQLQMYNQTASNLSPYLQAGYGAIPQLQSFLSSSGPVNSTLGQLSSLYGASGPVNSTLGQLSSLYGSSGPLASLLGLSPQGSAGALSQLQNMPGYQFTLQQGQQALDRSAASNGMLLSGGQLKAAQQYGQGLASTQYGNAVSQLENYGSDLGSLASQYGTYGTQLGGLASQYGTYGNEIAGLINTGESAGANTGNAGSAAASGIGSALTSGAAQQSSALLTGAQQQSTALQNYGLASASGIAGAANNIGSLLNNSSLQALFNNSSGISPVTVTPEIDTSSWSDRRLKTDIKKIGKTESGLGVYSYRFKGTDRTQIGVMADEVKRVAPSAVRRDPSGFDKVDYGKVSRLPAMRSMPLKRSA